MKFHTACQSEHWKSAAAFQATWRCGVPDARKRDIFVESKRCKTADSNMRSHLGAQVRAFNMTVAGRIAVSVYKVLSDRVAIACPIVHAD